MREYFIKTVRIGFSKWNNADLNLASQLWGEEEVTRFICSTGKFTQEEIANRLNTEIRNYELYHIQYWPIFNCQQRNSLDVAGSSLINLKSILTSSAFICGKNTGGRDMPQRQRKLLSIIAFTC